MSRNDFLINSGNFSYSFINFLSFSLFAISSEKQMALYHRALISTAYPPLGVTGILFTTASIQVSAFPGAAA